MDNCEPRPAVRTGEPALIPVAVGFEDLCTVTQALGLTYEEAPVDLLGAVEDKPGV